jgi:NAD+ kinase
MLIYKRIGLTVKKNLSDKEETIAKVVDILRKCGAEIFIDPISMYDVSCTRTFGEIASGTKLDAILVIGGDGTILRAVRELPDFSIPVLSVNRGVVGFLAEINIEEAEVLLPQLLSGEGVIEERTLLSVHVERHGEEVFHSFALNEAAISQGAIARLLDMRTDINGEPLATFHADGLLIATPTGSTAYSLAAGGPVVHPRLSALILTPINPHSLTQKPVVIPGGSTVGVDVLLSGNPFKETHVSLTLDGQVYEELRKDDRVIVKTHKENVKFIRRREDTFFHTLRTKLRWGERL